jgi:hypothetical protein
VVQIRIVALCITFGSTNWVSRLRYIVFGAFWFQCIFLRSWRAVQRGIDLMRKVICCNYYFILCHFFPLLQFSIVVFSFLIALVGNGTENIFHEAVQLAQLRVVAWCWGQYAGYSQGKCKGIMLAAALVQLITVQLVGHRLGTLEELIHLPCQLTFL